MRTQMNTGLPSIVLLCGAVVLSLGMIGEATARPKKLINTCTCHCDAGAAGFSSDHTYDAVAPCGAYEGKVCNFDSTNGPRTGKLTACQAGTRWSAKATTQGTLQQTQPGPKPATKATGGATGSTTKPN